MLSKNKKCNNRYHYFAGMIKEHDGKNLLIMSWIKR